MAKIVYARLCRKIKRIEQTGSYSLMGSFVDLPLTKAPIGFVLMVYWEETNETFEQSFAIIDAQGSLLDKTPTTECVLKSKQINTSSAFFYTIFPRAGQYNINVYQNGVCIESLPLPVVEASTTSDRHRVPSTPSRSPAQS